MHIISINQKRPDYYGKRLNSSFESKQNIRRNLLWAVIFLVIAAASIYTVKKVSGDFSFRRLAELYRNAANLPLLLALAALFGYLAFESLSLKTLLKSFGHKCSFGQSVVFTSADMYFSAITPSATGGQPACGYFMVRSGVPASCVTVCLVFNLAMYTLSIIIIALGAMIINPGVFNFFGAGAKVLILLGALGLLILASLAILVTAKRSTIDWLGRLAGRIGKKLRIIKNSTDEAGLIQWVDDYKRYADQLSGHGPALIKSLIFNILHRLCQLSITMFMYIAIFANSSMPLKQVINNGLSLLGTQSLISIGSTFIPIPGAMGYTDLMMLNAFEKIMSDADAASLELMSRFVSFYLSVTICFCIVIIYSIVKNRKRK